MRLTKKTKNGYFHKLFGDNPIYTKEQMISDLDDIVQKLGQLEDAEELCIKMTTQPIYEKFKLSSTHICKLDYTGYNAAYDFKNNCIIVYTDHKATIYSVNEYGKTWALTKEELL